MAMCDLPQKLVGEKILTRVPITSLKAVRSTCKTWDAITKNWVLGCKAARGTDEFLGFMTMNYKVYSVRFRHCEEDLVDVSVKQVDLLNQLEIYKVYHCDGLVLCVAKNNSKLVVWNPYLCETRSIGPRENFHRSDRYAIGYGYDKKKEKRNHKILRFVDEYIGAGPERDFGYEIYEIRSNSWRVLDVNPEWEIDSHQRGVSVKGNTYFFAHERFDDVEPDPDGSITDLEEDFLLCFDFTKERFGPRLPLPFHSYPGDTVTLSSVRDEQLAVLFGSDVSDSFEIWVTITVEPNYVSWSKFLQVETGPFPITGFKLEEICGGSFFVDEENNVAVVFELDGYLPLPTTKTARQHTAFVFGEDGYFKSVNLGEAPFVEHRETVSGNLFKTWRPPLVCPSSYRPSLVQVKQPRAKRRKQDMLIRICQDSLCSG